MLWRALTRSWSATFTFIPPMAITPHDPTTRRLATLLHHLRHLRHRHATTTSGGTPIRTGPTEPARAAVLICLFEGRASDLRVILTKRSPKLSAHSGEVSLPGGKAEDGDVDDEATALREAREEIGLDPSLVTVATVLQPILSKRLYLRVTPVVGILADRLAFQPTTNSDEVEAIFDAPLEMFLKDENRSSTVREWKGARYLTHHFTYESETGTFTIWGLTATILIRAASIIYQRLPSFTEDLPQ